MAATRTALASLRTGAAANALRDRSAAASLEYALLACVLALVALLGLAPFGTSLAQQVSDLSHRVLFASASAQPAACRHVEWTGSDHLVAPAHAPHYPEAQAN